MTDLQISTGTIARTVILFLALINQVMAVMGHTVLPIDDETIAQLVSLVATVGAAIASWWKNNSFTQAARAGDQTMRVLKAEKADID